MAALYKIYALLLLCVLALRMPRTQAAFVGYTEGAGCARSITVTPSPHSIISLNPTFVVTFSFAVPQPMYFTTYDATFSKMITPLMTSPTSFDPSIVYLQNLVNPNQIIVPTTASLQSSNSIYVEFSSLSADTHYALILSERISVSYQALGPQTYFYTTCASCSPSYPQILNTMSPDFCPPNIGLSAGYNPFYNPSPAGPANPSPSQILPPSVQLCAAQNCTFILNLQVTYESNAETTSCISNFTYESALYYLKNPFCIHLEKNDTLAKVPLLRQALPLTPSYEYISTIPDEPTLTDEVVNRCWKGRSSTREEVQAILNTKKNDASNTISMLIYENYSFHAFQAGIDSLTATDLETNTRYWTMLKYPNSTAVELFYGPCRLFGGDAYWMIILPNMTFQCPAGSPRNTNYLRGPMFHALQAFPTQAYVQFIIDNSNISVDYSHKFTLSKYGDNEILPKTEGFSIATGITSSSLSEPLHGRCLLVPLAADNFLPEQYWLVVPCDLLDDGIGKWGITLETFYMSQRTACGVDQGSGLPSPSMAYCLRNATECNATVAQLLPYYLQLLGDTSDGLRRIRPAVNTTIGNNQLLLSFNERSVPTNISLSGIELVEAYAMIEASSISWSVSVIYYRLGYLGFKGVNSGNIDGTFSADLHCDSEITVLQSPASVIIAPGSSRLFNFTFNSTSFNTVKANCTITLSVSKLPLWSNVNKTAKHSVPVDMWSGCLVRLGQPQIGNASVTVSGEAIYSFSIMQGNLSASIYNNGTDISLFNGSLYCSDYSTEALVINNSNFTATIAPNKKYVYTTGFTAPIFQYQSFSWNCFLRSTYPLDQQRCFMGDNTQLLPFSLPQCPPSFEDKKIYYEQIVVNFNEWASSGTNSYVSNGSVTATITGGGTSPILYEISYPHNIVGFSISPVIGNCSMIGNGLCTFPFTAIAVASASPNAFVPTSFMISILLENACATNTNKTATRVFNFRMPYNECLAYHTQPRIYANGTKLQSVSEWRNLHNNFTISVFNSGDKSGTFSTAVECRNLTSAVVFAIENQVQSYAVPAGYARLFTYHITSQALGYPSFLNCTANIAILQAGACWDNIYQTLSFSLDTQYDVCLNGFTESFVSSSSAVGQWTPTSVPFGYTSSITATANIIGDDPTNTTLLLTCLLDPHFNISASLLYNVTSNQTASHAVGYCTPQNKKCSVAFSVVALAVPVEQWFIKCYVQSQISVKQCQSPANKTHITELLVPLPYDTCAEFNEYSVFSPFPLVSYSQWISNNRNITVVISNKGNSKGTFTTSLTCRNFNSKSIVFFLKDSTLTSQIDPKSSYNQTFRIESSPISEQLFLNCTASIVSVGSSTCKLDSSVSFNFSIDVPYDPCLAPGIPDSFISSTSVATGNWTQTNQPFIFSSYLAANSSITGNSVSNVTITLACYRTVQFNISVLSSSVGAISDFHSNQSAVLATVRCSSTISGDCKANFTLSTRALTTQHNVVTCALLISLDILPCQSLFNKSYSARTNWPIPYDLCSSFNESYLLAPANVWNANPYYDKTVTNPLRISTTTWLAVDDNTSRSLLLADVSYSAPSSSTIYGSYSCAWPPAVTAHMQTSSFCETDDSSHCQFSFRLYVPYFEAPQIVPCWMNVSILPQPCWSTKGKAILLHFNLSLPLSPASLPQTEAYLLAPEATWLIYNQTRDMLLFGNNPLKAVASSFWDQVSYSTYGAWANFTVLNAGPAHATIFGNLSCGNCATPYLSTAQCFAFANFSCSLSFRILMQAAASENSSSLNISVTVNVLKDKYWSDVGKHFTQNISIANIPINECLYNTKIESYLVFPESVLLANPNIIQETQNPLGLTSSPWNLHNSSYNGTNTTGSMHLEAHVIVYGSADVFVGVFCPANSSFSLPSTSIFDPISINITTKNFSTAALISSNNTFLHCRNNINGTCSFDFEVYATSTYIQPLFCILVASINLEKCFIHPDLGKFFVQGFTLPALQNLGSATSGSTSFDSSDFILDADGTEPETLHLLWLLLLLPLSIAGVVLVRRYLTKSLISTSSSSMPLKIPNSVSPVVTGDIKCTVCQLHSPPHYACTGCDEGINYCMNVECHNALHSGDYSDSHRLYELQLWQGNFKKKEMTKIKYYDEQTEGDGSLLFGSVDHAWYKSGVEARVEYEKNNSSHEVHVICANEIANMMSRNYEEDNE